ncbi:hypothetical protein RRG08_013111 [Elysia crispata]|uniref:Uncharacterized protein n=1 Tax=Elysia crispata TaxID=231223 RepID=A0AAE1DQR7_9GAST|nr:hypothetical protein RRG08_013111 [Elysia crispata]
MDLTSASVLFPPHPAGGTGATKEARCRGENERKTLKTTKEEVGSYDNIALSPRITVGYRNEVNTLVALRLRLKYDPLLSRNSRVPE